MLGHRFTRFTRFTRKKKHEGNIEDIYDGDLYKSLSGHGGLLD